MPQLIAIPGQGTVEFPDEMSDDQITAAIQANTPSRRSDGEGDQLHAGPPPPGFLARTATAAREAVSPLLGPTAGQLMRDGPERWEGIGLIPNASKPIIPLPRIPQQTNRAAQIGAGVVNTGLGFVEFMESPLGLATGGVGKLGNAAVNRLVAGGYALDMGSKAGEAARHAGQMSVDGTLQQQVEADLGLAAQVGLPAVLGKHALAPGKKPKPSPLAPRPSPPFSEFGGEAKAANEVAAAPVTLTPPVAEQSAPARANAAAAAVESPGPRVESQSAPPSTLDPRPSTVPESPATLHGQLVKLHEGRAPAVLFTPGDVVPDWALKDKRFDRVETPAGEVVYDTAAFTKDEITRAVAEDRLGDVLGYGVPRKPAAGTESGVVVVRDSRGTELRAVVVDDATAPGVLKAAQAYAGPGDVVRIESPADVLAKRQAASAPPPETDQQRFGREQREASAALAKVRAAEAVAAVGTPPEIKPEVTGALPNAATPRELPADVKVKVEGLDKSGAVVERELPAAKAGKWLEGRMSLLQRLLECLGRA